MLISKKVSVDYSGQHGLNALTTFGQSFYNDTDNPYFETACGDDYITSYHVGALLTYTLILKLSNRKDKNKIAGKIDTGLNIWKIAESLPEIL